jgi:hypothetical protein
LQSGRLQAKILIAALEWGAIMKGFGVFYALAIGAIAACSMAPANAATLTGNVISGSYYYPDTSTEYGSYVYVPNPFTVGVGVESVLTTAGFAATSVDFDASSLTLTALTAVGYGVAAFNGPVFTVDSGNPFGAILSVTSTTGLVSAFLSGGALYVNWQGQIFNPGYQVVVNFDNPATVVPVPAALPLFATGLAGLGWLARRRRKQAA